MERYQASEVVPTHYVLFTLASIVGPSILYQELTMDNDILEYPGYVMLPLFLIGIAMTFSGVFIINGKKKEAPSSDSCW